MRIVVTRPSPQAEAWVGRLQARGLDAVALPLLAIEDGPDPAAVERARERLDRFAWIVFVSPTAVARFLGAGGERAPWPAAGEGRAAAPGAGTAEALRAAGVPPERTVAPDAARGRFDAESLWDAICAGGVPDLPGRRVLVVRGTEGRDWLGERFADAGATVETVAAYRRVDAALDPDGRERLAAALAAPDRHAWLVASGSAVDALRRAIGPRRDTDPLAVATAIATHPRIAERARAAGFGRVRVASEGFEAVVRCIESAEP